MIVTATEEIEVKVSADEAWKVYGTLRMVEMVIEIMSHFVEKFDVVQGDGGLGTVLHFKYRINPDTGCTGPTYYKEKFSVLDNEKRIKVSEGVEGGFLEMGFDWYRQRFEIIEKQKKDGVEEEEETCITRTSVEFETKDLKVAEMGLRSFLHSNVAVIKGIAERIYQQRTKED